MFAWDYINSAAASQTSDPLTKNPNCTPESGGVFILDEVNELLHDDVGLALSVLDVQHQFVAGEDVGVVVDVGHGHDGHGPKLRRGELYSRYGENSTFNVNLKIFSSDVEMKTVFDKR